MKIKSSQSCLPRKAFFSLYGVIPSNKNKYSNFFASRFLKIASGFNFFYFEESRSNREAKYRYYLIFQMDNTRLKRVGTTKSVNTVDTANPPITTLPTPR